MDYISKYKTNEPKLWHKLVTCIEYLYFKHINYFKSMSITYLDYKQIMLELLNRKLDYFEKFLKKKVNLYEETFSLERWLVSWVNRKTNNLLKQYTDKRFISIDEEQLNIELNKPLHVSLFSQQVADQLVVEPDDAEKINIDDIINRFCYTDKEKEVFIYKIIYNYTWKEIKAKLGKTNRQNALLVFQNVVKRIKSKAKTIDQLFAL